MNIREELRKLVALARDPYAESKLYALTKQIVEYVESLEGETFSDSTYPDYYGLTHDDILFGDD